MYPFSCRKPQTYTSAHYSVRKQSSTLGSADVYYPEMRAYDVLDNVIDFSNTALPAGSYSVDIYPYFLKNDVRDYTLTIYAPSAIIITDVNGNTAQNVLKAFDNNFKNDDPRANQNYVSKRYCKNNCTDSSTNNQNIPTTYTGVITDDLVYFVNNQSLLTNYTSSTGAFFYYVRAFNWGATGTEVAFLAGLNTTRYDTDVTLSVSSYGTNYLAYGATSCTNVRNKAGYNVTSCVFSLRPMESTQIVGMVV